MTPLNTKKRRTLKIKRKQSTKNPFKTAGILILISISILTLSYRSSSNRFIERVQSDVFSTLKPARNLFSAILQPIGNIVSGSANYNKVSEENKILASEIQALKNEHLSYLDMEQRLAELENLLHLQFAQDLPFVTCQVTSMNPTDFINSYVLGCGRDEGVALGMPVVTQDGLVGKINFVSSNSSQVLVLTDPRSVVGVKLLIPNQLSQSGVTSTSNPTNSTTTIKNTSTIGTSTSSTTSTVSPPFQQIFGVASGDGSDLTLSFVPNGSYVKKGTLVTTSGLDNSAYPGGIPVGVVSSVSNSVSSLNLSISLKPAVNFSAVEYVDVLQWLQTP